VLDGAGLQARAQSRDDRHDEAGVRRHDVRHRRQLCERLLYACEDGGFCLTRGGTGGGGGVRGHLVPPPPPPLSLSLSLVLR
jgi:hypothetical protein